MHYIPYSEDYLAHHGILGMKWGVRRWQNKDGSLTDAGRKRYGSWPDQKAKKKFGGSPSVKEQNEAYRQTALNAIDTAKNDKSVRKEISALQKKAKYIRNFDKLTDEEWFKYADMAAEKNYKQTKDEYPDMDTGSLEDWKKWYRYDDGDQGYDNSFTAYLESKGIDPTKYGKEIYESEKQLQKLVRDVVKRTVEDCGDMKLQAAFDKRDKSFDQELIDNAVDDILADALADYQNTGAWYLLNSR